MDLSFLSLNYFFKGQVEAQGNYEELLKTNPTVLKRFSFQTEESENLDDKKELTSSQWQFSQEIRLKEQVISI